MKQNLKRLLSFALMLILVFSLAVPALADDGEIYCYEGTANQTYIMSAKKNGTVRVLLADSNTTPFSMNIKDVTVKGTAGAKVVAFQGSNNQYGYTSEYKTYWEEVPGWDGYNYQYNSTSYYVTLMAKKPGTAVITYKVNGVAHTLTVNIKSWINPLKSIKMTGIKGGKNFVNKSGGSTELKLNSNVKKSTLKIVPASGWVIQEASITDFTTGIYQSVLNNMNGMTSAKINWGSLQRSHNYSIYVRLFNEKLDTVEYAYYDINPVT